MISTRDLKQLLRPLLKRRSDLVFDQGVVFFSPFTHYLRGIAFTDSRWSKEFEAHSFVMQLFSGAHGLGFDGNKGQHRYDVPSSWVDNREGTSAELCEHLEQQSLPLVEPIISPSRHEKSRQYMPHFLPGLSPFTSPIYSFAAALGACFRGDFNRAEPILANILVHFPEYRVDTATEEFRFHERVHWRMAYLLRLLRTDRARVPQLLHDWEAFTVNALKLTKYWKPTPFPCDG